MILVLLQKGKGANLGIAFGSGSSQGLLSKGQTSGNGLVKLTTFLAAMFFMTSLLIGYINKDISTSSLPIDSGSQHVIE
tara:strand:- start:505 stop:741 length:237 start_codon:yes stop_codon:yes gene_type:complete